MYFLFQALAVVLGAFVFGSEAQCINEVAVYNPNLRTQAQNITFFIVPVPKAAVLAAVKEAYPLQNLTLLDVPTSNTTLFPNGFPEGMHPVLADISVSDDIRMAELQIDGALIGAQVLAAYVGQDGSSAPLTASLNAYIAGPTGPLPGGLVPALASSLLFAGNTLRLGQFEPQAAAYQAEGAPGYYSAEAKWAILPNPISGPGVYVEAVDFLFQTISASASNFTTTTFKSLINQPLLLPSGLCQRNAYYTNNATADPTFTAGQVVLGPGADGSGLSSGVLMAASPDGSGVYEGVYGYGACAQQIGYNPQDCDQASEDVDPVALM